MSGGWHRAHPPLAEDAVEITVVSEFYIDDEGEGKDCIVVVVQPLPAEIDWI